MIAWRRDETIPVHRETLRKQRPDTVKEIQDRGQIMLVSVLNLIYREFLKRALIGMTMQGGRL